MVRPLVLLFAVLVLLGAACGDDDDEAVDATASDGSGVIEGEVNDQGSEQLSGDSLTIEAMDFAFAPTFVSDATGTVDVQVQNTGSTAHTFTIDALGIDEVIEPGDEAQVTVDLPEDGEGVVFVCRFHQDRGMKGGFGITGANSGQGATDSDDDGVGY